VPNVTLVILGKPLTFTTRVEGCKPPHVTIPHPGPCKGTGRLTKAIKPKTKAKPRQQDRTPSLPPQPPLKVAAEEGDIEPRPWQTYENPDGRTYGMWTEAFADQQAIRHVFRNIATGKAALDGVKVPHRDQTLYFDPTTAQGEPEFTTSDYHNDLISAARWLHTTFARQDKLDPDDILYRGMRLRASEVPKPGDRFSTDISSWATEDDTAQRYASMAEDPSLGRIGDRQVIFELSEPQQAIILADPDLDSMLEPEFLIRGDFEVIGVNEDDGYTRIQIRRTSTP
jgi:hypothetical protein